MISGMRTLLALLPDKHDRQAFVEAAQQFTPLCDGYLLSANSLPHVTLASFPTGFLLSNKGPKDYFPSDLHHQRIVIPDQPTLYIRLLL